MYVIKILFLQVFFSFLQTLFDKILGTLISLAMVGIVDIPKTSIDLYTEPNDYTVDEQMSHMHPMLLVLQYDLLWWKYTGKRYI